MEVTAGLARPAPSAREGNGADPPSAAAKVASRGGQIELAARTPSAMPPGPPIAGFIVPINPVIRGYPYIPPAYSSGAPQVAQAGEEEPNETLKAAASSPTPSSVGRPARASSAASTHGSKQTDEDTPKPAEPASRCPLVSAGRLAASHVVQVLFWQRDNAGSSLRHVPRDPVPPRPAPIAALLHAWPLRRYCDRGNCCGRPRVHVSARDCRHPELQLQAALAHRCHRALQRKGLPH